MKIGVGAAALAFFAALASCGRCARTYEFLSQIVSEGHLSVVGAAAVPEDATFIDIRSDVETGEYYVSYKANDSLAWIGSAGLQRAEGSVVPMIRSSIGFGVSLPPGVQLYYKCVSSPRVGLDGGGARELVLVGLDAGRRHFWNRYYDEELERVVCVDTISR